MIRLEVKDAMQKCTQPGCTGQIVDSVCDVCGHFYATLPASTAGPAGAVAAAPRSCTQPGCSGQIVDGICENCGYDYSGLPTSSAAVLPASDRVGTATSNRCTQPGCHGTIVDSVCEVCGHYYDTLPTKPSTSAIRPGITGRLGTPSTRLARSTQGTGSQTRRTQRVGIELLYALGVPQVVANVRLIPPVVPPERRVCGNCGQRLVEDRGVCKNCQKPYSFVPQLQADPARPVLGRFEIKGTMAFGGMGWIYLAHDRLLGRDIVLKGLKDSQDPELAAIAAREREFLAQVKHPSIVEIYDFLVYNGQGYIVMELVEGRTLEALRKDHGGVMDPVEACTYILEILPALGYLDSNDLVHCDFKPENVMVQSDRVKLIDLGTVRRVDDTTDVYGSPGYSAPEANDGNPSPLSDLWSVGKSLASLVAEFDYKGTYRFTVPPPSEVPVFREHESLYQLLLKATREQPEERFQTAEEMAQQLSGVIRQILRDRGGLPPVESTLFGEDLATRDGITPVGPEILSFPSLKPDPTDPAAQLIASTFPIPDAARRREAYEAARLNQFVDSIELALQLASEKVAYGDLAATTPRLAKPKDPVKTYTVEQLLAWVRGKNARDWRISWFEAQLAFSQGDPARAREIFEAIAQEIPGEIAPKLALGVVQEKLGNLDEALRYYDLVSTVSPAYTGAAFGLGRVLAAKHDRAGAVKAYLRVPATSNRYLAALTDLVRVILDPSVGPVGKDEILQAADVLSRMRADDTLLEPHEIAANLCCTAAELVEKGAIRFTNGETFLGTTGTPRELRWRAEREFRSCARVATSPAARVAFVDQANAVRPRTLF